MKKILEFGEIPPNISQELLREIYEESKENQEILSKINYKGEKIQ